MRIPLIYFFLLFFTNISLGQDCPTQSVLITNQQEMESFANNYPNCTAFDKSFTLEGPDIVSLEDLNFLRKLHGGLYIINTGLTNLEGLEELESINSLLNIKDNPELESLAALSVMTSEDVTIGSYLDIENNPKLTSLEGLEKLEFIPTKSNVRIRHNPALNICDFDNICQYLNGYSSAYKIIGNGEQCNFRESILEQCGLYPKLPDDELIFTEGFEQLDSIGLPSGWTGNSEVGPLGRNIKLVNSLVEGDSALWLSSNVPFFEGNIDAYAIIKLPNIYSELDVEMTLSCKGEGSCVLVLGQTSDGVGHNYRHAWSREAGDEGVYTVYLSDIKVNPPFAGFGLIELMASPVWTPLGSHGISEFTIDDLKVYGDGELVNIDVVNDSHFSIFPNPTTDRLYFEVENEINYSSIEIFNLNGALLRKQRFSNSLDVSDLPEGMYIVQLSGAKEARRSTFVKM